MANLPDGRILALKTIMTTPRLLCLHQGYLYLRHGPYINATDSYINAKEPLYSTTTRHQDLLDIAVADFFLSRNYNCAVVVILRPPADTYLAFDDV